MTIQDIAQPGDRYFAEDAMSYEESEYSFAPGEDQSRSDLIDFTPISKKLVVSSATKQTSETRSPGVIDSEKIPLRASFLITPEGELHLQTFGKPVYCANKNGNETLNFAKVK